MTLRSRLFCRIRLIKSPIVSGNWLAARTDAGHPAITREPTTRSSIEVAYPASNSWIEIASKDGCTYLAIPVDEVIDVMGEIGREMDVRYRETAGGGLAATPTGRRLAKERLYQIKRADG